MNSKNRMKFIVQKIEKISNHMFRGNIFLEPFYVIAIYLFYFTPSKTLYNLEDVNVCINLLSEFRNVSEIVAFW